MSTHCAERAPLWRRLGSVRLRAFFALGVVGVLGATGTTFAAWTDAVPVAGTSLTAGTIDLKVNNLDNVTGYTSLDYATLVPGSTVAGALTVRNAGTAPFKYTASSTVANATLGAQLSYVVTTGAPTGTKPAQTCSGTAVASGAALGGAVIGTGRLVAAGATETLCVQLTLSGTAPSTLQGASTTVGFTLTATSDLV